MSISIPIGVLKDINDRINTLERNFKTQKPPTEVVVQPQPQQQIIHQGISEETVSQMNSELKRTITNVLSMKFESMLKTEIAKLKEKMYDLESKLTEEKETISLPLPPMSDDKDIDLKIVPKKHKNKNRSKINDENLHERSEI